MPCDGWSLLWECSVGEDYVDTGCVWWVDLDKFRNLSRIVSVVLLNVFCDGWSLLWECSVGEDYVDIDCVWWDDPYDSGVVGGKIIWVILDGGFCFNLIVTLCGANDVVHEENRWLWTFGWNQREASMGG